MADENRKSSPPREPLTQIELLITLDRIQRQQKIDRDEQRREFELIRADLATAKDNDERFKVMETHFKIAKWFAGIAVVAGVGSLATNIAARVSVRIADAPVAASTAERMGPDRVVPPKPPAQVDPR